MDNIEKIVNNKIKLLKMFFIEEHRKGQIKLDKWNVERLKFLSEQLKNKMIEKIKEKEFVLSENNYYNNNIDYKKTYKILKENYLNVLKQDSIKEKMVDQIMMESDMNNEQIQKNINLILKEGFMKYIMFSKCSEIKELQEDEEINQEFEKIEFCL
jgi:hypothetical protein